VFSSAALTGSWTQHWPIWLVTATLVVAAIIDGWKLKVPNWLTLPMIVGGWVYSGVALGWAGFGWSVAATAVGLALLLPAYSIGGMGAGDVKLLAGVGAWLAAPLTLVYAFCVSALIGGAIALAMIVYRKAWDKHLSQFRLIANEIVTIRDPNRLSVIAAERKSRMLLLPYGIPIAIGSILYFAWTGMLI
jgi:prepilin peptidase CpaA